MAVYTPITAAQLHHALRPFTLSPLATFSGIAAGVSNSNFLLRFQDETQLILTLFESRTPWADLPYFIALMEHFAGHGLPCPRPVRDQQGEALFVLADHPAAMVSFLTGASVYTPTAHQCAAMGAMLARLHLAAADFPLRRANSMNPAAWQHLLAAGEADADLKTTRALAQEIAASWPNHLPCGAIHADLFPDNIFFADDTLSGVIDFYFACHDAFAYDLAITLNAWCVTPSGALDSAKARALLQAYQALRGMSTAEHAAMPLLLQGAALRFLATRHYDWLHHPADALLTPKDPAEYQRVLRFHQENPRFIHDVLP